MTGFGVVIRGQGNGKGVGFKVVTGFPTRDHAEQFVHLADGVNSNRYFRCGEPDFRSGPLLVFEGVELAEALDERGDDFGTRLEEAVAERVADREESERREAEARAARVAAQKEKERQEKIVRRAAELKDAADIADIKKWHDAAAAEIDKASG